VKDSKAIFIIQHFIFDCADSGYGIRSQRSIGIAFRILFGTGYRDLCLLCGARWVARCRLDEHRPVHFHVDRTFGFVAERWKRGWRVDGSNDEG